MIDLAVIFGSRAAEHDVSIITGLQALENADKSRFNAFPVYISQSGEWFIGEPLKEIKTYRDFNPNVKGIQKVLLPPVPGSGGFYACGGGLFGAKYVKVQNIDCAFLALHGMHGEDGTIQGLMELADIPYTGSGVIGSAVSMDKVLMKAVFQSMGLPVLEGVWFYRARWQREQDVIVEEAEKLSYPLFIKPANLGSSIGIAKAVDRDTLISAVETALAFDKKVLIEKGLDKPVEVNCACLGFEDDVTVSLCEQPQSWADYLSFEDKYMRGSGKGGMGGMKGLSRKIPAPVGDELTETIKNYTSRIFRALECRGVVRVDYMIDSADGRLYVNEINSIPGSMAFYLFEPLGITFRQLVGRLVEAAYEAAEQKRASTFAHNSAILERAERSTKIYKK